MLEPDEQSVRRWQWSGRQGEIIHRNETSARAGLLPPSGYNRLFHFRICLRQADGKQYVRSIQGAYGLFGFQKDPFIIIGIGDSCVAEEVIIKWPNKEKTETKLEDVPANYVLIVREGKDTIYSTLEDYKK